ncbi:TVP38/TMEM64 family protein [Aerococcus sp. UMB1112A]|uniref:TVP38/TMEM64 family protein n=1 Tax=Aerococcus sp. UMB1112A TaxID=3050609 RepID=UPI00254A2417|nr:TVP38/TMEM64 family protein [Aerococcus sp. UMB1112A]MDK8502586.1 TVP38/TMEM64 family protein [Aerococcus sp. UMB1112A]
MTKKTNEASKRRWLLLGIVVLCLAIYFLIPPVREWINQVFKMFATGNFDEVREFIDSYGGYAALISFFLMVLTAVIAPLPAFLITVTNANLFGWWQGAILSWSSAMVGAALCFYIARILGRDVVVRFTTKRGLESIENFFDRYGMQTILVARLLPFMSFDIVSYAAGLTSMGFWGYFIATGIGQLPATIIYSYVGGMLTGGAQKLVTGLLILFALSVLVALLRRVYTDRKKKKESLN